MVNSFRDLQVWQKAMDLVDTSYTVTANFPREEIFGLTAQIRRAAISIPSNIAEGRAIGGGRFLHHIRICLGSEAELETQIELSVRRGYVTAGRARNLLAAAAEVARMLHGLHGALKARQARARGCRRNCTAAVCLCSQRILLIADCRLPIADCRLPIADCRLLIAGC